MVPPIHPMPSLLGPALAMMLTLFVSAGETGSVRTVDGRTFNGQLRFNAAGALVVKPAKGDSVALGFAEVAQANFAPGSFFSGGSVLPNGWSVQDIGETRGFC